MESFSLLKYWRTGGSAAATDVFIADSAAPTAKGNTKTIVAAADCSDGEDGPYFDLEFPLPEEESDEDEEESEKSEGNDGKAAETEDEDETESESDGEEISVHENDDDDEEEEEGEIDFALDSADQNVAVSPSDELFFKGDLVSIEPSSILLNASEENSKLPVFLVKSATKFRVLLLKLKKSKSSNGENAEKSEEKDKISGNKSISVKFKVEEVPLVNLFTRESSSKENNNGARDSEDRKVMHKYLKMVKPFYIRVSKRYVDKLKFSGNLSFPGGGTSKGSSAAPPPEKAGEAPKPPTNNLQAGLRVVRKHLGKSRSASAVVSAASPAKTASERRDDSLLQVQDGIQGAILHCKRSFNASREMESSSSILCRSVSDPSYEKAKN